MADHSKPILTSTYANFVTELDARFDDLALGLDPAFTTVTNMPTNSIRWSSASNLWQKWNGSAWVALSSAYDIDIANGSVTNSPITTSAITNSPISGSTGSFTTLAASGAFSLTGDQVQASEGGTGQSSYTIGDVLFASGTAALSKLPDVATGNALISGGVGVAPSYGKVGLTTHVSGILPVANGGTGSSDGIFPSGTRLPFAQAAAPTGWTQDVSDNANNRMLRVVNTAGNGIGGSHSPILNNVVPSHTHGFSTGTESADHSHSGSTGTVSSDHSHSTVVPAAWGQLPMIGENVYSVALPNNTAYGSGGISANHTHAFTSGGRSAAHTHSGSTDNGSSQTNWAPRYIDLIICTKN